MSFRISLSGINAATTHLDVTAHNIANVNTTGFKQSRAEFADVFATAANDLSSVATGSGVKVSSITQQFSQGNIDFTNNNLDLAISGEGFFVMAGREGLVYTRAGAFSVDREGFVVNSDLQKLQVFPVSEGGNGIATGALSDLRLQTTESPPKATTEARLGINLPANAPAPLEPVFDPSNPDSYNHATSVTVYDSLGTPFTMTTYFFRAVGAPANEWQMRVFAGNAGNPQQPVDGGGATGTHTNIVSFTADGQLDIAASGGSSKFGPVTIDAPSVTGANPIVVDLDLISATQFGREFSVNSLLQDGFTTGRMVGVEVDPRGIVSARFSNGQLQTLGQVAMAVFNNPNGLRQIGDTQWAETFTSGSPRLGEAGTSNFGLFQAGALESSNVDLTEQLVQMITAQRNFQANAQMIQTADQVTQVVLNLR